MNFIQSIKITHDNVPKLLSLWVEQWLFVVLFIFSSSVFANITICNCTKTSIKLSQGDFSVYLPSCGEDDYIRDFICCESGFKLEELFVESEDKKKCFKYTIDTEMTAADILPNFDMITDDKRIVTKWGNVPAG